MGRENTYGEIIDVLKLPKDMVEDLKTMGGVFGGEFWEASMSVLATCFPLVRDANLTYSRLLETIEKIDNEAKSASGRHPSWQELCKEKGFDLSTYMSGKALDSLRLAISYDKHELGIAWQMLCHASFIVGGALNHSSNDISEAIHTTFASFGEKGGGLHHEPDRQAFKDDYRYERGDDPANVKTRPAIFADLKEHYSHLADSTLEKWAKEADKKDGFIRKPGRPKKE